MDAISNKIIELKKVAKSFTGESGIESVLEDVDLSLSSSETIAILGPTGCGKTTLLYLMAGLLEADSGTMLFDGRPVSRAHPKVALVLQQYGLFPWKNVRKNVELGLKIRSKVLDEAVISELLREMGIDDKQSHFPHQLSGGQKQRVAIARALILKPSLLLLDEPFAALDTLTRERLQDLLATSWQKRKFAMILVTHNIHEAVRLGRKIAIMSSKHGQIVELIENPDAMNSDQRGTEEFHLKVDLTRSKMENAE